MPTSLVSPETNFKIDQIEANIADAAENGDVVLYEPEVEHEFVDGLYRRICRMKAATVVVSHIHKTRHFFVITKGNVAVWDEQNGLKVLREGHHGITEPGTRRVLYNLTDVEWATYHVTDKTNVDEIGRDILEPHDNPMLSDEVKSIVGQLKGLLK